MANSSFALTPKATLQKIFKDLIKSIIDRIEKYVWFDKLINHHQLPENNTHHILLNNEKEDLEYLLNKSNSNLKLIQKTDLTDKQISDYQYIHSNMHDKVELDKPCHSIKQLEFYKELYSNAVRVNDHNALSSIEMRVKFEEKNLKYLYILTHIRL